ncbi:cupin domain-containing protein [Roseibium sp. RKSG952]|uniref:cupin domain-containing protein n=1 Tax=Roseibium sp. RKSG952 TaxID=2529384 RepID=UPI0012BD2F9B|nr:cupin domain-containing protein [Roseibium sp. RKSG952]MTH95220.1 cupin domain-containing protein [Roseibium sp. RKSG952]
MNCRRIVTGHDETGAAVFLCDKDVDPIFLDAIPGFRTHEIWNTGAERDIPHGGKFPEMRTYFPDEQSTIFRKIIFPPTEEGESGIDLAPDSVTEINAKLPGALDHFELSEPGMHTTASVDYGVVLDGEIELELDHGQKKQLKAGDVVIQNGTRHAWRNHSGKPAVMVFILLGARKK